MGDTIHRWIENQRPMTAESLQLVITSPPTPMAVENDDTYIAYNHDIKSSLEKGRGSIAFESQHRVLDKIWRQAYDDLQDGGYLCVIIQKGKRQIEDRHAHFDNASRITYACQQMGYDALPSIYWKKPSKTPPHYMGSGMLPAGAYVVAQHDHVLIFRKGGARSFTKVEKERRAASALFCEERNLWYLDLWDQLGASSLDNYLSKDTSKKEKTAKRIPFELYRRLIMMHSIHGDTVYDPFGFNTKTALACMISRRDSISASDTYTGVQQLLTKRRLKALLNDQIASRLTDHMSYAKSKDGMLLRYKNQPLGFPVQTQQEKHIDSQAIQSFKTAEEITVKYRKWKKTELQEITRS